MNKPIIKTLALTDAQLHALRWAVEASNREATRRADAKSKGSRSEWKWRDISHALTSIDLKPNA